METFINANLFNDVATSAYKLTTNPDECFIGWYDLTANDGALSVNEREKMPEKPRH